jgi:hypothetical protein
MKRHRHTPEQIVRKLREGERLLNEGKDLTEVVRHLGIAESTWNLWRSQYGGHEGRRGQAAPPARDRERPTEAAGRGRAGQGDAQGAGRGKLLTPERRRRAVVALTQRFRVSERGLCGDRPAALHPAPGEYHLATYAGSGKKGLLFCGPQGQPLRRASWYRAWHRALKKVGIEEDLKPHDLRHTGNTLTAMTGASTKELMARLGQSRPRAALIYQHAAKDRDREIAAALNGLIETKLKQQWQTSTEEMDKPREGRVRPASLRATGGGAFACCLSFLPTRCPEHTACPAASR